MGITVVLEMVSVLAYGSCWLVLAWSFGLLLRGYYQYILIAVPVYLLQFVFYVCMPSFRGPLETGGGFASGLKENGIDWVPWTMAGMAGAMLVYFIVSIVSSYLEFRQTANAHKLTIGDLVIPNEPEEKGTENELTLLVHSEKESLKESKR